LYSYLISYKNSDKEDLRQIIAIEVDL